MNKKAPQMTKRYKLKNGSDIGYKRAVSNISKLLRKNLELTSTQITDRLEFKVNELTFLLPYLTGKNILSSRRTDAHTLVYYKNIPNALAELFYPQPKYPQSVIKGRYTHRSK